MSDAPFDPRHRYVSAITDTAQRELGRDLPLGTTVVASARREGSPAAVAYPLGDRTIIWCAPELATRLETLNRPNALTGDEVVAAGESLGGTFAGSGRHRVLNSEPASLSDQRYRPVKLDRDLADHRELLAAFIEACPEDDLDEAELDLAELDPAILALIDANGSIASYASGRPWEFDADFDDVAVITHPAHRGQRLGAIAVAEFAGRRRQEGRLLFYNHDVENHGSNRVAESVGFEPVVTVVAFRV